LAESFEYAIRKDVRNNPIVREVDEARLRELWKTVGFTVGLVIVLLFFAWPHFELMVNGYKIEKLQKEKDVEEELARQLRLELETLRAPQRIELLATTRLHLVTPKQGEAIVLERAVPAELPASSIVASR
jgi:hypothetical protein